MSAALLRIALAPLFLAEPADRATVLLLASGVFTIAIAAVVRRAEPGAAIDCFFSGAGRQADIDRPEAEAALQGRARAWRNW